MEASTADWTRALEAVRADAESQLESRLEEARAEAEDALAAAEVELAEAQTSVAALKMDLMLSPESVDGDAYDVLRATMEELGDMQASQSADLLAAQEERQELLERIAQLESDLGLALEAVGADAGEGSPQWAGFFFERADLINLRAFVRWHNAGEQEQTPERQLDDWQVAERSVRALEEAGAADEELFRTFRAEAAPFLAKGDMRPFNADALQLVARIVDAAAAASVLP
jgi:hypothetical protein